uniref:Diphthine--ammonia ligase n=1 Tax=Culicoides sonorensis TaxID=179676 RepID=A0A336M171_CULSO
MLLIASYITKSNLKLDVLNRITKKMRVVALISGGKDSIFNALLAQAEGHEIVALGNLHPKDKDELDSYMYQTVGHQGIEKIAEAMELPLYRKETKGNSLQKGKSYEPTDNDEVEDLYKLLKDIKEAENVKGVACGAILSDYQRVRVENVCQRLELISLTYLWRRDQTELLQEMIDCKIDAIIIKIAALGLMPNHLGKSIGDLKSHLCCMHEKYKLNVCGEGGEYETFTLDCPLFKKRIVVSDMQIVMSSADPICPVGYINFTKLKHAPKISPIKYKVKTSRDFCQFQESDEEILYNNENDSFSALNDDEVINTINSRDYIYVENKPQSVVNRKGWLFLTGIQCSSSNPAIAIFEGLQKIEQMMTTNDYSLNDLVTISLYIDNMNHFNIINTAYLKIINFQNPPTRICVECELPTNCSLIMEAIAHKPKTINADDYSKKTVLHVQGISHWAPANIGPYSQSIKIGLIPGNLEIIEGGIYAQSKLVLRHISRIAETINTNGKLRDVLQGICYVTKQKDINAARKVWESQSTNAIIDYVVVRNLPREALVEFQVWTHLGNDKFEYEETGCSIDNFTVLLKRRWNYENTNLENDKDNAMAPSQLMQVFQYFIRKMCPELTSTNTDMEGKRSSTTVTLYIRVFYHTSNSPPFIREVVDELKDLDNYIQLAFTLVPVYGFQSKNDFLSMNAIRHE